MILKLRNWKCHRELDVDLSSPVDLMLAHNGDGKTSLVDALEFVLQGTGKLAGIDRKTELGMLVISDGQTDCAVELQLDDWSVIRRMNTEGTQKIKLQKGADSPVIEGKLREQQTRLDEWLGVDEQQVRAVLDARVLLEGPEQARRALLFGVSGVEVTEQQVLEGFKIHDLEGDDVRVAAQDVTLQGWRSAETLAGERRAAAKRAVADLTVPEPQHLFRPSTSKPDADSLDLRKCPQTMLAKKREANEAALAEATLGAGMDVGAAAEALRAKRAELVRAEAEHVGLKAQAQAERPAMGQLELKLSGAHDELAEALSGFDACQTARDEVGDPISIAGIEKPKVCPAIPGGFECPVTPTRLNKHRTTLKGTQEARAEEIEQADDALDLARNRLDHARQRKADAEGALDTEKALVAGLASLGTKLDRLDGQVDELVADHTKAEAQAGSEGQRAFHQSRLDATLETIAARDRYDDQVAALERHETTVADLEEKVYRHDAITQLLKSTGLETQLLAGLIGPLQAKLDEIGVHVGAMRITPALDVELKWGEHWRRFTQLSESQRERMAVGVQHAVAALAGFPILIVDRVDHLDPMGKGACMKALASVAPQYQAVLALATLQSKTPTPAKVDGVTTWHLSAGAVARVE